MKNYLGNLIARHMNQADVLLPRHASRFEPQSSVLQSDGFQGETEETDVEMKVAETFGDVAETLRPDSEVVAPISEPVSVARNQLSVVPDPIVVATDPVSVGPVSKPVFDTPVSEPVLDVSAPVRDVSVTDFVAPVSPIPSGIERRVVNPSAPSTRSPESVVESSGPARSSAELPTPTMSVSDGIESPVLSRTTSAVASERHDEPTVTRETLSDRVDAADRVTSVSRVASTSRVHSDDDSSSESRTVASTDVPTQFVTANELVTPDKPLIANEQVTEIERVTAPLYPAVTKPNQPLTQRAIGTQRAVPTATTETETEREFRSPAASGSFIPTTKSEPFTSDATTEHVTSTVSYSERGNVDPPKLHLSKPQQANSPTTIAHSSIEPSSIEHSLIERSSMEHSPIERSSRELLSAVVVPESKESSQVVNAVHETQVSPQQPESLPEKTQTPQRARQLETSVARSPVDNHSNINGSRSTRLIPPNDIAPADPGPTINVTIGRIEVRAATASETRPQKQRREQQVLSLDEYLNQRSAGGR